LKTGKEIYAAFGRGEIDAILDRLDKNVEWETTTFVEGVPWHQPRRGRENVRGFLEALSPLQFNRFDPNTFFETGDKVSSSSIWTSHRGASRTCFPSKATRGSSMPPAKLSSTIMSRIQPSIGAWLVGDSVSY